MYITHVLHVCSDDQRRMSERSQCRTSYAAALDLHKEKNVLGSFLTFSFKNTVAPALDFQQKKNIN